MKKDKKNVVYKKLTVEIPLKTFLQMDLFCKSDFCPGVKDLYYCDFIREAIEFYIDSHQDLCSSEKIHQISAVKIRES